MKTQLPKQIKSLKAAKLFLVDLIINNEVYHPEDDAFDVEWETCQPTTKERKQLNLLMNHIYKLDETYSKDNPNGFDPCGFIMDLTKIGEHNYWLNRVKPVANAIVIVKGGCVTAVVGDGKLNVEVIDYDTDGASSDDEDVMLIPQALGFKPASAYCYQGEVFENLPDRTFEILNAIRKHRGLQPIPSDTPQKTDDGHTSISISWSTLDLESKAQELEEVNLDNGETYTEENPQRYDRSKFADALQLMERHHDCELGITWYTVQHYLDEYCKL